MYKEEDLHVRHFTTKLIIWKRNYLSFILLVAKLNRQALRDQVIQKIQLK